jgi:hypothetical protein
MNIKNTLNNNKCQNRSLRGLKGSNVETCKHQKEKPDAMVLKVAIIAAPYAQARQ